MSQTIYLYSLWRRQFISSECILKPSANKEFAYAKDNRNNSIYRVSSSPKTVYNGLIWLEEQDDKYAAELLIAYQNQQISKLETRIGNHKSIIETLNKMIEEEYSDD